MEAGTGDADQDESARGTPARGTPEWRPGQLGATVEALLLPLGMVVQSEAKTQEEVAEAELRCERGLSLRLCSRRRHRQAIG